MQPYRCYFLDGANHVVRVEDRECFDDASATRWLDSLRRRPDDIYSAELWCRARLVRRCERSAP